MLPYEKFLSDFNIPQTKSNTLRNAIFFFAIDSIRTIVAFVFRALSQSRNKSMEQGEMKHDARSTSHAMMSAVIFSLFLLNSGERI